MDLPNRKSPDDKIVLFVWDGRPKSVRTVGRALAPLRNVGIFAVRLLPHKSGFLCGNIGQANGETSLYERKIRRGFAQATGRITNLQNVPLECLYGDQVEQISWFASLIQAELVIAPRFQQSEFSMWLHGNLNDRLRSAVDSKVVFVGSTGGVGSRKVRFVESNSPGF